MHFAVGDALETRIEYDASLKDDLYTPCNYKTPGATLNTISETHLRTWTRSAANARRRALDLVNGIGQLGDEEDDHRQHWTLPKASDNDDRRQPLVWEGDT